MVSCLAKVRPVLARWIEFFGAWVFHVEPPAIIWEKVGSFAVQKYFTSPTLPYPPPRELWGQRKSGNPVVLLRSSLDCPVEVLPEGLLDLDSIMAVCWAEVEWPHAGIGADSGGTSIVLEHVDTTVPLLRGGYCHFQVSLRFSASVAAFGYRN